MDYENDTGIIPLACTAHGCPSKAQVSEHKKKKRRKTSAAKFFQCFQKDDVVFPCVVPVDSSSMATTADTELNVGKCNKRQGQQEQHGFFRALKAILFKLLLVKKIEQRKSDKSFASIPIKESKITSGQTQEWSDQEGVSKMITKTTSSGGNTVLTIVKEKDEVVFPTMPPSLLKKDEACQDQWMKKGRHRLSHMLKAILFETAMAKKIQARKSGKKYASKSCTEESCKEDHNDPENVSKSASSLTNSSVFISSTLASSSSSSAVSRSTSHSRSLSERIRSFRSISSSNLKANLRNLSDKIRSNTKNLKSSSRNKMSLESINSSGLKEEQHTHCDDNVTRIEKDIKKAVCYRSVSGLCFLLISLMGLIVYGKLGAILCTSLWLLCVPLWSFGDYNNSATNKVVEKKQVTINGGGILQSTVRTRTRVFQSQ